ncbi:MAG: fructoselysine 3-epimerase [Ferruginibacter sp.]|nr:fructoselysine 3-epimerase [Ferruginibacter sp.]
MNHSSRREFLQSSAVLVAAAITGSSFNVKKSHLLLSFSTLGCPDWSFQQVVDFAALNGYDGIEIRGIQRELDLERCSEFTPHYRQETLKKMKQKRLRFVNLGSSANLHFAEPVERKRNLDEARRYIDLAHELKCPFIRVFPNKFPKGQERNITMDLISKGLLELGAHAKGKGVTVLMETHGDLVKAEDIKKVMQSAVHPNVGLVWDIANMWTITKEPPVEVYAKLKKYIHHTHIKDAKIVDGVVQYTLLGQGEVPIFEAIKALANGGYKGYYSFEWEKLWHPEIAAPEIALADYPKVMKQKELVSFRG